MLITIDEILKNYPWIIPLLGIICTIISLIIASWNKINPAGGYRVREFQTVLSSAKGVLNENDSIFLKNMAREKVMEYFTGVHDEKLRAQMIFIYLNTNIPFSFLKKVNGILFLRNGVFSLKVTFGYIFFRYVSIIYGMILIIMAFIFAVVLILNFVTSHYITALICYVVSLFLLVFSLYSFTRYPCNQKIKNVNHQLAVIDMRKYYEEYLS